MLKKIVAIRNIGRFQNSALAGNHEMAKHTFIVGANGYGKTTICSVLRSLQTGNTAHVAGRTRLGATDASSVELLFDTGMIRFNGRSWSESRPHIAIFDGFFVAENIYAGEVVNLDHKRNLHKIILGERGKQLAEADVSLVALSRTKTTEITAAERAISTHIPSGMKLQNFLLLPNLADINELIEEQEQTVESVKHSDALNKMTILEEFCIPDLPDDLIRALARTIDQISDEAEKIVASHLAAHSKVTREWISRGISHANTNTVHFAI